MSRRRLAALLSELARTRHGWPAWPHAARGRAATAGGDVSRSRATCEAAAPWTPLAEPFPEPEMRRIKGIHFVGIGGCRHGRHRRGAAQPRLRGQRLRSSAIAPSRAASLAGYSVRDRSRQEKVAGADVVVTSTAVADDNPEVVAARVARLPGGAAG